MPARESERARDDYLRGLVGAHFANIWRLLLRLGFPKDVADDAAQDLFFVAARRVEDIVPGREGAFLITAALRIARKLNRKRKRDIPIDPQGVSVEVEEPAPPPDKSLDDRRARELLYRLLSELEERQRVVFVMFELEGMTMQEISELLEIPPGTVASRLRSARDDFRARLERHRSRTGREAT